MVMMIRIGNQNQHELMLEHLICIYFVRFIFLIFPVRQNTSIFETTTCTSSNNSTATVKLVVLLKASTYTFFQNQVLANCNSQIRFDNIHDFDDLIFFLSFLILNLSILSVITIPPFVGLNIYSRKYTDSFFLKQLQWSPASLSYVLSLCITFHSFSKPFILQKLRRLKCYKVHFIFQNHPT